MEKNDKYINKIENLCITNKVKNINILIKNIIKIQEDFDFNFRGNIFRIFFFSCHNNNYYYNCCIPVNSMV